MSKQSKFRITGGRLRGRILSSPPNLRTRPMQGSLREALFNILGPDVEDASVLDLFSGTGSVGIEALSRGAASCVFCENYRPALKVLHRNIEALGLAEETKIVKINLLAAGPFPATGREPFKIVFLDPPFAFHDEGTRRDLGGLVERLASRAWLEDGAVLVLHLRKDQAPPPALGPLRPSEPREYGSVFLTFYRQ